MENGSDIKLEEKLSKNSKIVSMGDDSVAYAIGYKCGSRTVLAWKTLLDTKDISLLLTMNQFDFFRQSKIQVERPNFGGNEKVRFCIVRDPIERFVRTYVNKIAINDKWKNKPTFDEFFDTYQKNIENEVLGYINIGEHLAPMTDFYGKNPSVFTHIFNMQQFDEIKSLLEAHAGIILPRLKFNDTSHYPSPVLNNAQVSSLQEKYKEDYEIYGRWFK